MADSPSTKPAPATKRPTLLPQAEHAGKPAMPLGAHLFTLIGSRNRAHLHLLSNTISRNHACIITGKSGVYVRDLASRAGVIVNARKVKESELQDGDLVQIGSFKFKFQEPAGPIRLPTGPRPPLAMIEMDGRALTPMDERTILIGRRPGCDITLDSPAVSNTHSIIFECDGKRYVRDLGSRTGTIVNGAAVHQHALEIGDQIRIGTTTLRYIDADMPAIDSEEIDHALPLEAESFQAAAHEESHAPVGLHFDDAAHTEPIESDALAPLPVDDEQIPLVAAEPEPAQPDFATTHAEPSHEIDFATDQAAETAPEVPVEEEIPLVQHDVTAPAAVAADPAEDGSLDFWTPPTEQAFTADVPEPVEPVISADSPDSPAVSHAVEADDAFHLPEFVEIPEEQPAPPVDHAVALEAEVFTAPTETPAVETSELTAPPDAAHETAAREEQIEFPAKAAPLPALDELEAVPAEPESSPPEFSRLESSESRLEPDLAEPIEPASIDQPSFESHAAEPIERAEAAIEQPAVPIVFDAPAAQESVAEPSVESESSVTASDEFDIAPTEDVALPMPTPHEEPAAEAPSIEAEHSLTVPEDLHVEPLAGSTEEPAAAVTEAEAPAAPAEIEPSLTAPHEVEIAPTVDSSEAAAEPTEPETTPAADLEPAAEAEPLAIEDVDLSTVDFHAGTSDVDVAADTTVESSEAPTPLLDLLPTPTEDAAAPSADITDLPPGGKRGGRGSRRKQAAARTPRKKKTARSPDRISEPTAIEPTGIEQTDAIEAADAAEAMPSEQEPAEASDATPASEAASFVASESVVSETEPTISNGTAPALEVNEVTASDELPEASVDRAPAELRAETADEAHLDEPAETEQYAPQAEAVSPAHEEIVSHEAAPAEPPPEAPALAAVHLEAVPAELLDTPPEPPPFAEATSTADFDRELGITALEPEAEVSSEPSAETASEGGEVVADPFASEPPVAPVAPAAAGTSSLWKAALEASQEESGTPSAPTENLTAPVGDLPEIDHTSTTDTTEVSSPTSLELGTPIDLATSTVESTSTSTPASIETIAETEPTLESALDLEPSLDADEALDDAAAAEADSPPFSSLSDTAFDAIVADFAGEESLPLVEENHPAPPASLAHADAPGLPNAEPAYEGAQTLAPLGGVELPPLELGDELTFGPEAEEPTAPTASASGPELAASAPAPEPAGEISLTAPAADAGFTTSEAIDSTLGLDSAPTIDSTLNIEAAPDAGLDFDLPGLEQPSFDPGLEWEEPAESVPEVDENGLEFEDFPADEAAPAARLAPEPEPVAGQPPPFDPLGSPPTAEARSETRMDAAPPASSARPQMNPFFGMERDLGTFIGGMPLPLAPAPQAAAVAAAPPRPAPQAPTQLAPSTAPAPAADESPAGPEALTFDEQPDTEMDLDKLFEGEEPLELFDETADQLDTLPDSLDAINDIDGAIGEPKVQEPAAPVEPVRSVAPAAPLRSLTADPSAVQPKPAATSVTVPPFAGARPAGRPGANPFAGLAGLRATDVFSQTAFPTSEAPLFQAQPIDIPPMTPSKPPGGGAGSIPGFGAAAGSPKANGDLVSAPPPPAHRPVAPRPTAAQVAGEPHDKRPWWKNIRVLLPLLVLLIIAAVVAIIRFMPPKAIVQGTLQMKGIDDRDLGVYARREQIDHIRLALREPTLRQAVIQRLQSDGVSPGFVGDPSAFEQLAEPANSPFEGNRIVFQRPQADSQDGQRLTATLQALYLVNKTAAEQSSHVRDEAAVASEKVKKVDARLQAQRDDLMQKSDQIKASAGSEAADLLANPTAAVDTLQQQNIDLHKALEQANADVKQKHDDWERAQASAQQGPNTDPKLMQIRQNLASLNARLTVARAFAGGQLDPAGTFGDAIGAVDGDLLSIASASKDAALSAYVATARRATSDIRALLDVQKQDSDRIAEVRQQLAGHREAHLRQVWAADETLKSLLEQRDAQAHRFGTASDSGLTQDAAHIRGVLDDLDQKIEARRQSLATTGQASDQLQQNLEQTIEHLRSDQHDNDAKIVAALGRMEIPPVGKLPPNDEQVLLTMHVGQDVEAASAAHDQYASGAKPSAADARAQVRKLEADVAEQQAQLDAYEQRSDAKAAVATARQALDAAQDAEAKAQVAYAANLNGLINARQVKDAQAHVNDTTTERDAAQRDAQAKAAQAAATPVLLPPDPQTAVQVVAQADQRVWYLAGAIGLIVLLFAGPLWMAARTPPADLPYATIQPRREAVIESGGHDDEQLPLMDDDEHPALT
jgi:pSer/pThr/pTyr-binding forkhead associated (FHA) protein